MRSLGRHAVLAATGLVVLMLQPARAAEITVTKAEESGHTTSYTYQYDARGTTSDDTNAGYPRYNYDSNSTSMGNTTTYSYDALDRETQTGPSTYTYDDYDSASNGSTTYDSLDQTTSSVTDNDTLGGVTRYQYDAAGRDTVTQQPADGSVFHYQYDTGLGTTDVEATDPLGRVTTYSYDSQNRLIESVDPLQSTTTTYDQAKETIDFTDNTQTQYDALGRITSSTSDMQVDFTLTLYDLDTNQTLLQYDYQGPIDTTDYRYDAGNVTTGSLQGALIPGDHYEYSYSFKISGADGTASGQFALAVPEPALGGAALVLLAACGRRRARKRTASA